MIVGAGTAGLSGALSLGRALRKVLVLDGGAPRNVRAEHSHNLFTRDGAAPDELLGIAKKDLEKYETVEVRRGVAVGASGEDGDFRIELDGGETVATRKVLLASGVVDVMPEIPGFAEAWGRGIHHCPFCHGWELRGRPLAVYGSGDIVLSRVELIRNWSRDLVVITDGTGIPDGDREKLAALGVPFCEMGISRIEAAGESGKLLRITLGSGSEVEREGIFANPPQEQRSSLAEMLGCEREYVEMMRVYTVKAHPMTRETTVKGIFCAGDASIPPAQSLPNSVATGSNAGAFMAHALCSEDLAAELVPAG
ncbi:NAD(P)/FAD-dependent oxidoreductase [Rubrobacter indicoceani]|uniref:NAD(P)/FAD-dependent oxidoreductase n=1 Tax=Rubrobacter indicoceani TaxID=2051957 RepID=UPI0013C4873A|nr:NAD(P)/FAD-dependent oxidoreductase [Rubrobacter indicoceani]